MSAEDTTTSVGADAPLRRTSRLGFGVGDFGLNIFWNMTNIFVLFYYTDVLGLPNAVAGYIVMGAMIWDGITDPAIGLLASKTMTRWGKYRPYIVVGALPLAASFALMFHRPDLPEAALIVYAASTHILFRTLYTIVGVPYSSLTARLTRDADERGSLAVYRLIFAAIAAIVVAALTLDGAKALGGGDLARGFGFIAMIYGALGALAIILCFVLTTEEATPDDEDDLPSLADIWRMLSSNSAFWLVFAIVLFGMSGATISGKAILYYIKYNLDSEHLIGLISASVALAIMLALPVWGAISKRASKRTVWASGMVISICVALALFLNPWETPQVVIPLLIIGATGSAAGYFSVWATIPDTVEFGEWKSGVRAESVLFGAVSLAQKVSLGVAVGILGMLLDVIGYRANELQSPETLFGLKVLISILPMGFAIVCLVLILNYKLDQKRHAAIVAELNARRHANASAPNQQ